MGAILPPAPPYGGMARIAPNTPKSTNFDGPKSASAGPFLKKNSRPGAYSGPVSVIQSKKSVEGWNMALLGSSISNQCKIQFQIGSLK